MKDSSSNNINPTLGESQESSPEVHPRDGHLRIPNKVAEALARLRVSGSQAQILWAVLRKTLGWQKPGEWKNEPYPISLGDLIQATGISRRWLLQELDDLTRRHILIRQQRKGKVPFLSLNLDVASWGVLKPAPVLESALVSESALVCAETSTSPVLKPALVPASNQARLNKPKETLKKTVIPPTTDEANILNILSRLKSWRYDEVEDLAWLGDFTQEFPDFTLSELRAARDYYSGKPPPKHKGGWKNRFRNWMIKKPEFEQKEPRGPRGKSFEQFMKEQQEGS